MRLAGDLSLFPAPAIGFIVAKGAFNRKTLAIQAQEEPIRLAAADQTEGFLVPPSPIHHHTRCPPARLFEGPAAQLFALIAPADQLADLPLASHAIPIQG